MSILLASSGQTKNYNPGSTLLSFRNAVVHLRFPFSFLLMPVFLFAVSQTNYSNINIQNAILSFIIIHVLVFPSSNGYNSYHDRDTNSIGLIKKPPKVSKALLQVTNIMDLLAISAGLFISIPFSFLLLIFILMSRAYSNRRIRIKKFPVASFLIVAFFQGGYIYLTTMVAILEDISLRSLISQNNLICITVSTLFMGSIYPLTQIYQHESDKKDGIITLSYLLGYRGSFIMSASLFFAAILLLYFHFDNIQQVSNFVLFITLMIPVILFMGYWSYKVFKDNKYANYKYTMIMNLATAFFMNTFFTILILQIK